MTLSAMSHLTTLTLLIITTITTAAPTLWVPTTPRTSIPYAIKQGHGIRMAGGNTYPVTGNSSGKAFCILNTNAGPTPGGASAGVFPHVHKRTYENFYAVKGRVQLWGQNLDTYKSSTSVQETRVLGPGDIGAIPPNTIHTFLLLEPDTQLTGVLVPGGFEEFFFAMGTAGPTDNSTVLPGAGGFDIPGLAKWDVYPQLDFVPRRDVVNGKAGGEGSWYDGLNSLPEPRPEGEGAAAMPSAPVWIAKNYGPKYLNDQAGRYQIVAPFVTGLQTNWSFSQGTVTVSRFREGSDGSALRAVDSFTTATAFMVEEGQLEVRVEGFEPASLINGDVVFVPGNVSFSYAATAEFTKFMYVTGGGRGAFDEKLMAGAKTWNSAFFPGYGAGGVARRDRI